MSEVIVPGRYQRDNNVISHWWSFEDLTGTVFTSFDLFFGTLQGGTAGMNPVMDKYYRLMNVGVMLRHISPTAPTVAINWRRNESASNLANFVVASALRAGQANKSCGSWSVQRDRPPCASYNLTATVASPGIAFPQMLVHFTYGVKLDAL